MRLGLVDCSAVTEHELAPARFPSPALLRAAAAREATSVVYLEPAALAGAPVDRVLAAVPAWCAAAAARCLGACTVEVEVIDPWRPGPAAAADYRLAPRACHGDVDLAPHRWPVHPWVAPSAGGGADPDGRLRAAVAGLSGLHTTRVVLGDEHARLTPDRLRLLAELITGSLRGRKSLVELALRVWPEDLAATPGDAAGVIDHLSLLPIVGLDLLLGTMHPPSLAAMDAPLSVDQRVELVAAVARAGLGPVTTLSIVAGLPGEEIRDSIAALDRALRLAAEHQLAAVRCSLWIGDGGPPADRDAQRRRFLASHPGWTEEEYRGFHDLVAVIRNVAPDLELIGPGFLPGWDAVP